MIKLKENLLSRHEAITMVFPSMWSNRLSPKNYCSMHYLSDTFTSIDRWTLNPILDTIWWMLN